MVIADMPSWLKISIAFFSIIALYRIKIPLGIALLLATLALAFVASPFPGNLNYLISSLIESQNILMLILFLMLLLFTKALKESNRMEQTVSALRAWVHNHKILISGLPALVGLLPMPGGALFSAPLVQATDPENRLNNSHKAVINYWFRHIWEYWWPLYPGVVLAIRYSTLPIGIFIAIQLPLTFASIVLGYIFLLKKITLKEEHKKVQIPSLKALSPLLGPILLLLVISMVSSLLFAHYKVPPTHVNIYSMLLALSIALGWIFLGNQSSFLPSIQIIRDKNTWSILLILLGVQAFSSLLQMPISSKDTLVSLMRDEFMSMGIPIILVIILVPFIAGIVTGIAVGFVGVSFPLIYALLGNAPSFNSIAASTTLAYTFGYLGMILSPIHICYIVTNEYFNSRIAHSYRYLFWPTCILSIVAVTISGAYYFLLK